VAALWDWDSTISFSRPEKLKGNVLLVTKVHCGPCPGPLLSPDQYRNAETPPRKESPQIRMATTPRPQIAKRRSTRIALNTSIGLSGHDRQKCPFTMPAKATNLNRHGAAIHVARDLLVGSIIVVRNPRGTQVSARMISQLAVSHGVSVYAIEFMEQDDAANNFWGITFPTIASRVAVAEETGMARRRRGVSSVLS
jgi:hypothetical protein